MTATNTEPDKGQQQLLDYTFGWCTPERKIIHSKEKHILLVKHLDNYTQTQHHAVLRCWADLEGACFCSTQHKRGSVELQGQQTEWGENGAGLKQVRVVTDLHVEGAIRTYTCTTLLLRTTTNSVYTTIHVYVYL